MSKTEMVILVNERNEVRGEAEKLKAHKECLLHRAFSVLIFNATGEMLIHQRAAHKYHSPLLWTNACCSHPHPGESTEAAVQRRFLEELGFTTAAKELCSFVYQFYDEVSELWEYEHDTVFAGFYEGDIPFNKNEMETIKWVQSKQLLEDIAQQPEKYTYWFKEIMKLPEVLNHIKRIQA